MNRVRVVALAGKLVFAILLASAVFAQAADYPAPVEGDYVLHNFKFASGETLPELRIHYRTLGKPEKDAAGVTRNAVLITHGTTGSMHAKFPHYGYRDMVEAQFRLLTDGLGVNHARIVMGTSMGGMHTWLWGEIHPDFMDALLPLASVPMQISGRNRAWRRLVIDAIRHDPDWREGDYTSQPPSLRTAAEMLWLMSSNPRLRQAEAPTLAKADEVLDKFVADYLKTGDANDMLYAVDASHDYDPGPAPEKIRAPLLAINFSDIAARDSGADYRNVPGAGAAGGLGFALMSFCAAQLQPGFELVAKCVGLEAAVRAADVVITGEGCLDAQTHEGKAPAGVANLARAEGKRVFAIVGHAERNEEGLARFDAVLELQQPPLTNEAAMATAATVLRARARDLAREWLC